MTIDAAPVQAAETRTPRWVLVILFVSLAVNLLIIGLVAGSAWRFRHAGPPHAWAPPNLIGYSMSLDRERNKRVREATSSMRHAIKPLRREIHQAREDVTSAIIAEPFDQAKFDAAQARLVDLENKARAQTIALYTKIAQTLTPEERRSYKEWRERRRPRSPGFFDDLDGPPPGKGPMQ